MNAIKLIAGSGDLSSIAIAIIGAIISIIAAVYLTSRKINADLRLRRVELTNLYAENILRKRLEIYPEVWFLLSDYVKLVRDYFKYGRVKRIADVDSLRTFYDKYNEWNSKNALVLSGNAALVSGRMRREVHLMLEAMDTDERSDELTDLEKQKVRDLAQRLELALRIDVGILEVDDFEQKLVVETYWEIKNQLARKD